MPGVYCDGIEDILYHERIPFGVGVPDGPLGFPEVS